MNLAWKSLHDVLVQNEKENTQHLDQECVQTGQEGILCGRRYPVRAAQVQETPRLDPAKTLF